VTSTFLTVRNRGDQIFTTFVQWLCSLYRPEVGIGEHPKTPYGAFSNSHKYHEFRAVSPPLAKDGSQ